MSFEKTQLLRHATVEKAYKVVADQLGLRVMKTEAKAAEIYSQLSDKPKPNVAAALLFGNTAFHEAKTVNATVGKLADFVLSEGYESQQPLNGQADRADIALAVQMMQAKQAEKEIADHRAFYIFQTMQNRMARIEARVEEAASLSGNPRLIAAAQQAIVAMHDAQNQRIDKVRSDSVFSKSDLPAHALIEKVYEAERYHDFQVNPHVMPLRFEMAAVKILLETMDRPAPEIIAAALLNQVYGARAERIEYLYGPRVAELHAETAPRLGLAGYEPDIALSGVADIRAAFLMVAMQSWMDTCQKTPKSVREESLCDVEHGANRARKILAAGHLSPRLAARLATVADSAAAMVHAPENTAIRKPGTPRPLSGW